MNTGTATIDVSTNGGWNVIGYLQQYPKLVSISNPLPDGYENAITFEEMNNKCMDLLSELYNTDMRALKKELEL